LANEVNVVAPPKLLQNLRPLLAECSNLQENMTPEARHQSFRACQLFNESLKVLPAEEVSKIRVPSKAAYESLAVDVFFKKNSILNACRYGDDLDFCSEALSLKLTGAEEVVKNRQNEVAEKSERSDALATYLHAKFTASSKLAAKACSLGNASGCLLLSRMENDSNNPKKAHLALQKACDLGSVTACVDLARESYANEETAHEVEYYAKKIYEFGEACLTHVNFPWSAHYLLYQTRESLGVRRNTQESYNQLEEGCRKCGDETCCLQLDALKNPSINERPSADQLRQSCRFVNNGRQASICIRWIDDYKE